MPQQVTDPRLLEELERGSTPIPDFQAPVQRTFDSVFGAPQPQQQSPVADPALIEQLERGEDPSVWNKTWAGRQARKVTDAAQSAYDMAFPARDPANANVPGFASQGITNTSDLAKVERSKLTSAGFEDEPWRRAIVDALGDRLLDRRQDTKGNEIIKYRGDDGQEYETYVNRPGMDTQDWSRTLLGAFPYIVGSSAAGRGLKALTGLGKSLWSRVPTQALTAAGISLGQDVAAGTDIGQDELWKSLVTAGFGAAGEVAGTIAPKIWRKFFQSEYFDPATGTLTEAGRRKAAQMGIDPSTVEGEAARRFKEIAQAEDPYAAMAGIQAGEFKIPTSVGQRTKDASKLGLEEEMRRGLHGPEAYRMMQEFDQGQRTAFTEASQDILRKPGMAIAPTSAETIPEASQAIGEGVRKAKRASEAEITKAWPDEDMLPVFTKTDTGNQARQFMTTRLNEALDGIALDQQLTPTAYRMLSFIDDYSKNLPEKIPFEILGKEPRSPLIDMMRRRLLGAYEAAESKTDRRAARAVYSAFNEWIADVAENQAVRSAKGQFLSPTVGEQLKTAIATTREQKQRFAPRGPDNKPTPGAKIINDIIMNEDTPERIGQSIFGVSTSGLPKAGTVEAVKMLRDVLDANTFDQVKASYFLRMISGKEGTVLSPTKLVTAIDRAFENQGSVIKQLFNGDEQALIKRYREAAAAASFKPPNPSGTSYELERMRHRKRSSVLATMLRKKGGGHTFRGEPVQASFYQILARVLPNWAGLQDRASRALARKATSQAFPRAPDTGSGRAGVSAAYGARDEGQENEEEDRMRRGLGTRPQRALGGPAQQQPQSGLGTPTPATTGGNFNWNPQAFGRQQPNMQLMNAFRASSGQQQMTPQQYAQNEQNSIQRGFNMNNAWLRGTGNQQLTPQAYQQRWQDRTGRSTNLANAFNRSGYASGGGILDELEENPYGWGDAPPAPEEGAFFETDHAMSPSDADALRIRQYAEDIRDPARDVALGLSGIGAAAEAGKDFAEGRDLEGLGNTGLAMLPFVGGTALNTAAKYGPKVAAPAVGLGTLFTPTEAGPEGAETEILRLTKEMNDLVAKRDAINSEFMAMSKDTTAELQGQGKSKKGKGTGPISEGLAKQATSVKEVADRLGAEIDTKQKRIAELQYTLTDDYKREQDLTNRNIEARKPWYERTGIPGVGTAATWGPWLGAAYMAHRGFGRIATEGDALLDAVRAARAAGDARGESAALLALDSWRRGAFKDAAKVTGKAVTIPGGVRTAGIGYDATFGPEVKDAQGNVLEGGAKQQAQHHFNRMFGGEGWQGAAEEWGPMGVSGIEAAGLGAGTHILSGKHAPLNEAAGEIASLRGMGKGDTWRSKGADAMSPEEIGRELLARRAGLPGGTPPSQGLGSLPPQPEAKMPPLSGPPTNPALSPPKGTSPSDVSGSPTIPEPPTIGSGSAPPQGLGSPAMLPPAEKSGLGAASQATKPKRVRAPKPPVEVPSPVEAAPPMPSAAKGKPAKKSETPVTPPEPPPVQKAGESDKAFQGRVKRYHDKYMGYVKHNPGDRQYRVGEGVREGGRFGPKDRTGIRGLKQATKDKAPKVEKITKGAAPPAEVNSDAKLEAVLKSGVGNPKVQGALSSGDIDQAARIIAEGSGVPAHKLIPLVSKWAKEGKFD